jgi:hypothetical protein
MTTMNAFDRQLLADMLLREGITAVLSELAWLQAEADLAKHLRTGRTDNSGVPAAIPQPGSSRERTTPEPSPFSYAR